MKWLTFAAVCIFMLGGSVSQSAGDQPAARLIMEKVDARDEGDAMTSDMEMVLIDRRGNERKRTIQAFKKERGEDTLQVMFFLFPPDVEGTGFLTYDHAGIDDEDDQWLYLPALQKTKRIAASGKSGSFMGSDFNYSDLTTLDLENYDFSLLKEDEVRGEGVWVIEARPRSPRVVDETGYEKSLLLVRQDNYFVIRAVSWVKGGEDLRYLDVTGLELIDGIWVATQMSMTTKRSGEKRHATRLTVSNVVFGKELPDELFTVHRLESGP